MDRARPQVPAAYKTFIALLSFSVLPVASAHGGSWRGDETLLLVLGVVALVALMVLGGGGGRGDR